MVFLFTPPFTQLNTPYPATAYLKGFLNTRGIASFQADLGIEVISEMFSGRGLERVFAESSRAESDNARRIYALRRHYIKSIDAVVGFLQGKNPTLAYSIAQEGYLPQARRFEQLDDMEWAFGTMGIQDKAKHLATLYLEDLSDYIQECLDPHFGFSRYAERLGRIANEFDELYQALQAPPTFTDVLLFERLRAHFERFAKKPLLVCFSVPFPGNLYAAFRAAQWIKAHWPSVRTAMGGGFANTELRSLSEERVFEFFDFVTLDDGEAPVEHLVEHLLGRRPLALLKRCFALNEQGRVEYFDHSLSRDYKQSETGTPDYSDLPLEGYLSVTELANPMHRLWSDGRWNKLTMAHGCYWGKCTFCDVSLDYIRRYEPLTARLLCDRMEQLMEQTGQTGFHFVDEAAPPALMRELALEILRRGLTLSWWTNIRFEKSFSLDLCLLLKASGCVAVSGGLEVASDRLLGLIQKGVTVAQVACVCSNFEQAGIMVHAYLMYGFPTQTAQETVDSLEMVRQLFEQGVLQSGFWHRFAMTAHSPVGMAPQDFSAVPVEQPLGRFANNDLPFEDPTGADHERFSLGLRKSLFNYMHGIGTEAPLQTWFDFKIPRPSVPADFIQKALGIDEALFAKPHAKAVLLCEQPQAEMVVKNKRGVRAYCFEFQDRKERLTVYFDLPKGEWLLGLFPELSYQNPQPLTLEQVQKSHRRAFPDEDFNLFWYNPPMSTLRRRVLVLV